MSDLCIHLFNQIWESGNPLPSTQLFSQTPPSFSPSLHKKRDPLFPLFGTKPGLPRSHGASLLSFAIESTTFELAHRRKKRKPSSSLFLSPPKMWGSRASCFFLLLVVKIWRWHLLFVCGREGGNLPRLGDRLKSPHKSRFCRDCDEKRGLSGIRQNKTTFYESFFFDTLFLLSTFFALSSYDTTLNLKIGQKAFRLRLMSCQPTFSYPQKREKFLRLPSSPPAEKLEEVLLHFFSRRRKRVEITQKVRKREGGRDMDGWV